MSDRQLDTLEIAMIYDVPPWVISPDYPRCWRNRMLWQLLRVLFRMEQTVRRRQTQIQERRQ